MPFAKVADQVKLYYDDIGKGNPIIFVHGFSMSHSVWERTTYEFKREYRVLSLDLRGHASSDKPSTGYNIDSFALDIHNLVVALDLKNPIYVGWSLGVAVGLKLASTFSNDISKLILIDGTPCWGRLPDFEFGHPPHLVSEWVEDLKSDHPRWAEKYVRMLFKENPSDSLKNWLWTISMQLPLHAAIEIILDSSARDLRSDLQKISHETLIIHGRHDKMDYLEAGEYMAKTLHKSKLVIFENSGHVPFFEEQEKFHRELGSFLKDEV